MALDRVVHCGPVVSEPLQPKGESLPNHEGNTVLERARVFIQELRRRKVARAMGGYLVLSFVVLQVVDATFDLVFEDPEAAGQWVLVGLVVLAPVAVVLSWMFDLRPPKVERDQTGQPETATPRSNQRSRSTRVAVLPLTNLSEDPENLYFSEGVTDDIATSIGRIQGLTVLSRGATSAYRDVELSVQRIATELGASTVVLGSVRRVDQRVRIVVAVVDARTGDQLWSDTFDRELRDIFEVQSEVAQQVADALRHRLRPTDRRRIELVGTSDVAAYDLYLRGRWLWNRRTKGATSEALRVLQQAVEQDPGFALAHAAIAEARTVLAVYGSQAPKSALAEARRAVDRALVLDPSLGEALAAQACLTGVYDWDWSAAEAGYRRALAESPSYATGHQWFAMNLLTPLARFAEAREELECARSLDADSAPIRASRGIIDYYDRDFESAVAVLEALSEEVQGFALGPLFLGQSLVELGRFDEGISCLTRATEWAQASSESLSALGYALARADRVAEATEILDRLGERGATRYVSKVLLAQVLIGLRRFDEALDQLSRAVGDQATDLIWLGTRPVYDDLRGRPEFADIVNTVGVA